MLWSADNNQAKSDPTSLAQQPVSPFKLSAEGAKLTMEIGDDGVLIINEKEVGRLSGDGILLDKNGKELARLKPDGMAVTKDGNPLGKVRPNGDIEIDPDKKFTWNKGSLKLGDDGPLIELVPDKPEARRWASFLLLLNFTAVPQEP